MLKICLSLALLVLLNAAPGQAQDMAEYYTVQHPEEFDIDWTGFYHAGNLRTAETRAQFPHHLDLAYGADPKQRLDLYLPRGKVDAAPIFLFLHGGGFREGDRAHYGYVAAPYLQQGALVAVASYRLTGKGFHYPDQPQDAQRALKWLFENVREHGGDPMALHIGGHSAGAILAADVGVNRAWMPVLGLPKEALRGIVAVSGPYDLRPRGRPGEQYAYAPTPALRERASPILQIKDPAPAFIVAVGDEKYRESSESFAAALNKAGVAARYLFLAGEDHRDTVVSLADENSELFKQTAALLSGRW